MKFSIVIPVYKTEHLLKRCLDSFVAQTDGDFEAIVVDDASPGEESKSKNGVICPEIVARYDARFKYVRHERNLSLFQARQTGLRLAQGEYVIPFDSDDYALPKLLEELSKVVASGDAVSHRAGQRRIRRLPDAERRRAHGRGEVLQLPQSNNPTIQQSNNSPDLVVYQMMYDNGSRLTKPSVRYRNEFLSGAEALDRFFASKIQCAICGKAVRREIYLKAMDQLAVPHDFYLNSSEDLCQTFPVLLNAQSVATISYPGYRYWLNDDSLTTTLTDPAKLGKAAESTARVFSLLKEFVLRREGVKVKTGGQGQQWCERLDLFMRPTLRWYLNCLRHLPEAGWRACVAELNRHFAPDLIAREAMLIVEESATYRLGRALVTPLRRMLCRRF